FIYFSSYLTTTQFLTLSLHDALPIFQYLDFRSGQIGLSIFFIFLYSPKDTTVASFGDVPFQGEHKIGELLVRYQVIGCSFRSCFWWIKDHGTIFNFPRFAYFAPVVIVPPFKRGAIEQGGPFRLFHYFNGFFCHFFRVLFWFFLASKGQGQNGQYNWFFHNPSILFSWFLSISAPANSSEVFVVASMMWSCMNLAPSRAPCSGLLMQHSHSITAHTSHPYWVSLEKMVLKSIWPSPKERYLPALSPQSL